MFSRKLSSSRTGAAARLRCWATGLLLALPLLAGAQPAGVPAHWISYAQLVGAQLQERLSDPASDTVQRLHAWMQERMLQPGAVPAPRSVLVRLWIAPDGRVERFEHASLGQAQADADLRQLVQAQALGEPPPPDMRQPLTLDLALQMR